jgi:hypothetical protein
MGCALHETQIHNGEKLMTECHFPYLCTSVIFKGILSLIAPSGHSLTQQLQYQQASGYVITGKLPLGVSK